MNCIELAACSHSRTFNPVGHAFSVWNIYFLFIEDVGQDSTGKLDVKARVSDALGVCELPEQEEVQVAVWHINSPTSFYVQVR